jgi:hypothetical protein
MIRFVLGVPLRVLKYLMLVAAVVMAWEHVDPVWRIAVKKRVLQPVEDGATDLWKELSSQLRRAAAEGPAPAEPRPWPAAPALRDPTDEAAPRAKCWAELGRELERIAGLEAGR